MVQRSPGPVLTAPVHRAAVLGRPIAHSLSPALHRRAYAALDLTGWTYDRFDVGAEELPEFVAALGQEWAGLSLTMPLKEQALLLAETASPIALQTGAVNTLVRTPTGWLGDNTDVAGVLGSLAGHVGPSVHDAVLIGSGATARSCLAALSKMEIGHVTFVVRADPRESTLAQARDHGMSIDVRSYADSAPHVLAAPLVISTVPAGAADPVVEALDAAAFDGHRLLAHQRPVWMDVVYAGWPTALARAGEDRGVDVVGGLDMLVHQAAEQVRLMTGHRAPLAEMFAAGRAALAAQEA